MNSNTVGKVLIKQLKISGIPLILALIYATYGYYSAVGTEKTNVKFINTFGASFFFLMWLVGQYLRTEKDIKDSSNYASIQASISDVMKSINKLHKFQFPTSTQIPTSNNLLLGAKKAVDNGHVLAGLMQAGVAFEQAVISKAGKHDLYREDSKTPISKTLQSLGNILEKGTIRELFAVWKLRNQLVHLTPEAAQELENRPELIKYFEWAISELEKPID